MIKKEILSFATIRVDHDSIMLSKTSQTEKGKYCVLPLKCGILKSQTCKNSRAMITRGWRVRELRK